MRRELRETLPRLESQAKKKKDSPSTTASVFSSFSLLLSSSPFKNTSPESSTVLSSSKAEGGPSEADPTGRRSVLGTSKLFASLEPSETKAATPFVSGAMDDGPRLRAMGRPRGLEAAFLLVIGRERMV